MPVIPSSFTTEVVDLLLSEAQAIQAVAQRLDPPLVERALDLLLACRGQVVLIGVGKSGMIARKIAATLTSTGTKGVFLHPSDALHGDLGLVHSGDVAILLSNSGETEEVLAVLPYLKQRGVHLIALVGNLRSTLAQKVDVALDAGVDKEACPLNLAPTTSTTVALALGDALAMTLMRAKGLTPEDFALNHPAGRLGKRLTLRVQDLMHRGKDLPLVLPEATWLEVIQGISQGGLGAVAVVDPSGVLWGLITDGDLRRALQKVALPALMDMTSTQIMTPRPIVTYPETLAYEALQLMEDRPSQISVLPVVDAGICVGLIRLHDIVRSGL